MNSFKSMNNFKEFLIWISWTGTALTEVILCNPLQFLYDTFHLIWDKNAKMFIGIDFQKNNNYYQNYSQVFSWANVYSSFRSRKSAFDWWNWNDTTKQMSFNGMNGRWKKNWNKRWKHQIPVWNCKFPTITIPRWPKLL